MFDFPGLVIGDVLQGRRFVFNTCRLPLLKDRRDNFQAFLEDGIDTYSLFGGKLTGPSAWQWIKMTLPKFGFVYNDESIINRACTDNNPSSQAMMRNFKDPHTQQHLLEHAFVSMESHLSNAGYRMALALRPDPQASIEIKGNAHELLRDYLEWGANDAWENRRATATCLMHPGKLCPIFASGSIEDDTLIDLSDSAATVASSEESQSDGSGVGESAEQKSPDLSSRSRWAILDLGSPCIDHAMFGQLLRFAGPSTEPYLIAMGEIVEYRPPVFVHEITAVKTMYLVKGNQQLKDAGYEVLTVVLCPSMGGTPNKKPRRYSLGWLADMLEFEGSEAECIALFRRRTEVSGDVYFCMDDDRTAENRERAALRGNVHL